MRHLMFSKHLQDLSVTEAGKAIHALGFQGVELTVRAGGHVATEHVGQDLPRAVDALRAQGVATPAIVVEIHGHASPNAEAVCAAAAAVGATTLRTSSLRYTRFGAIREEIAAAQRAAKELEELGREYGLRLCVHCHSGAMLSAQGPTLARIVEETDPRHVGVSFDLAHLTLEGGLDGWRQSIDLLQNRVGIVAVKNFGWFSVPDAETGGVRWIWKVVPLSDGTARWREALHLLRQLGWDADGQALVSLHSEYQGGASWRELSVQEVLDQTRLDLAWFQRQAAT